MSPRTWATGEVAREGKAGGGTDGGEKLISVSYQATPIL